MLIEIAAILSFINVIILIILLTRISQRKIRKQYQEILIKEIQDVVTELNAITERNVTLLEDKVYKITDLIRKAEDLLNHPLLRPEIKATKQQKERFVKNKPEPQHEFAQHPDSNVNKPSKEEEPASNSIPEFKEKNLPTPDEKLQETMFTSTEASRSPVEQQELFEEAPSEYQDEPKKEHVTPLPLESEYPSEPINLEPLAKENLALLNAETSHQESPDDEIQHAKSEEIQPPPKEIIHEEIMHENSRQEDFAIPEEINKNNQITHPSDSSTSPIIDTANEKLRSNESSRSKEFSHPIEEEGIPLINRAYLKASPHQTASSTSKSQQAEKKTKQSMENDDQSSRVRILAMKLLDEGKKDDEIIAETQISKGELALLRSLRIS